MYLVRKRSIYVDNSTVRPENQRYIVQEGQYELSYPSKYGKTLQLRYLKTILCSIVFLYKLPWCYFTNLQPQYLSVHWFISTLISQLRFQAKETSTRWWRATRRKSGQMWPTLVKRLGYPNNSWIFLCISSYVCNVVYFADEMWRW